VTESGPETGFEAAAGPLRAELLAHCYRMLGTWDEAEDAVQDTYLRGWRGWDDFQRSASPRTWLYRIATNVCLNALRGRGRRALPAQLGPSADGLDSRPAPLSAAPLVQPFPGDSADLRLALIAGMQVLPATQRAVLLLRDVLGFPAAEVAGMLGTTVTAVKSSLQRARTRLAEVAPRPDDIIEPAHPRARLLLDAYVAAFQSGDVEGLVAALLSDATLELPPDGNWFAGKALCAQVFAAAVGQPGDWRMDPVVANGQPAVLVYWHGQPYGVAVVDVRLGGIAGVTAFGDPALAGRFAAAQAGR
jgi:RNA polymerase sigma-70 factor, ECF subfamily